MAFPGRKWLRRSRLLKQLSRLHAAIPSSSSTLPILSVAAVVGAVSGLGAIFFRELAKQLTQYAWGTPLYRATPWRRHTHLGSPQARDPLSQMTVAHVMTTRVITVPTTMELAKLACVFERWGLQEVLVIDPYGAFYGLLSLADLKQSLMGKATGRLTAGEIATTNIAKIYPDELVSVIALCMAPGDLRCLPVVDRSQPPRLLGVVYREDLNRAYDIEGRRVDCHLDNS